LSSSPDHGIAAFKQKTNTYAEIPTPKPFVKWFEFDNLAGLVLRLPLHNQYYI
jgi:hypothetical protein